MNSIRKYLMIFLIAGLMAACSEDEVLPVDVGLQGSYVPVHDCEGCEGSDGSEREPPGGRDTSPDEEKKRANPRGITTK